MIATSPEIEHYVQLFERYKQDRAAEPSWLASLRQSAMRKFQELGLPTRFDEEWRYTYVAPLFSQNGNASTRPVGIEAVVRSHSVYNVVEHRMSIVNGVFEPRLSFLNGLPKGVIVGSLSEAISRHPELVESHLGRYARFDSQALVALNTALFLDGAFIYVPRGVVVEQPIHLLHYTTVDNLASITNTRTLIVAEENSQVTVIETYTGREGDSYVTNAVTEIVLAESAVVDHYKVQLESIEAGHIATQQTQQARSSNLTSLNVSFGGDLVRNDINNVLGGQNIESTINGLYVVNGKQHVDTHTAIDHANPHCNSHEHYKGVMDGHSTAVFNGKIFVRQDAQKTDAKQTNQNLLLSADATINTKPQLEIFADDVRCTHGATIGQLDPNALFYLRARGIGEEDARNMLIHAFADDLLTRIKIDALREELETLLFTKLPKELATA
jgi:Fe-S cluster assembly protein SufD